MIECCKKFPEIPTQNAQKRNFKFFLCTKFFSKNRYMKISLFKKKKVFGKSRFLSSSRGISGTFIAWSDRGHPGLSFETKSSPKLLQITEILINFEKSDFFGFSFRMRWGKLGKAPNLNFWIPKVLTQIHIFLY